ncbi:hypothetical protein AB3N60_13345 [Leptospira sp. WS39.C2]
MKDFLLCLLPWTKREWSDFFADLTPLLGLWIFTSKPQNIMIALYPELYFVFGFGMIRLFVTAVYAAIQPSKGMGLQDLEIPKPIIGKIFYFLFIPFFGGILFIALTCMVTLLLGFNFFFYMMIELFLSVATTGRMETNFNFPNLYNSLSPNEQYYIWGIFLFTLYRYLPKVFDFFENKTYKRYKESWSSIFLGTPKIPKQNQFQKMLVPFRYLLGVENNPSDIWDYTPLFYITFLFLYFGALILMFQFPISGPIITLVIKAFVEMYCFRLFKETNVKLN